MGSRRHRTGLARRSRSSKLAICVVKVCRSDSLYNLVLSTKMLTARLRYTGLDDGLADREASSGEKSTQAIAIVKISDVQQPIR